MSQPITNTQQPNPYGHSKKFLRMRKLFLFFPFLALPSILIGFVAMGGGKGNPAKTDVPTPTGLNTNLPAAHFDKPKGVEDKLTYYEKADADSIKFMTQARQDPYRLKKPFVPDRMSTSFRSSPLSPNTQNAFKPMPLLPGDTMADELVRRINSLKLSLSHKQTVEPPMTFQNPVFQSAVAAKMENLLHSMKAIDTARPAEDPQMVHINQLLDKIIRIQHPAQAAADSAAVVHEQVAILKAAPLDESLADSSDGFYTIDDPVLSDTSSSNVISAAVHGDQVLASGSTVELSLMQVAVIAGKTIPKDNALFGEASLNGDRLLIGIHSIRSGQSIYPVSLQVYDLDGLPGIHIPGNMTREVSKQSAGQGIDAIGLTTLDASVGAQATQAGIQAAKSLMSKKVRLTRVTIPAGYQVLLKNTSPNH